MRGLLAAIVLLMGTTAAYAAAPAKVLLLPFDAVGDGAKPWIAKAVQQNLVAELSRVNSVTPTTGQAGVANLEAAVQIGENAKADYVVYGTYQTVENDLRITGQVADVSKKEVVAGLKATGTQRDLFGLEDVIANQVKRALPQPVVAQAQPEMLKQPPAVEPEPPAPEVAVNERARELEEQLDRAIERLKYSEPYYPPDYGYYPGNYVYSGLYAPYVYYTVPSYRFHHRAHGHFRPGGTWLNGRPHNGQFKGGSVRVGGGVGYGVPRGSNYVNFGRMSR